MEALQGVQSAGLASNTPLNNRPNPTVEFTVEGRPPLRPGERQSSDLVIVSPNYFTTAGVPLLQGREFTDGDGKEAPRVALISELMARRYWPQQDPLGSRIKFISSGADSQWITVAGIAADVKQSWFDRETRPQVYLPYLQAPQLGMHVMLRTSGDPMSLVAGAHAQIHGIDPDQLINDTKTLGRLFVDEGTPFRFAAVLMLVFGGLALVLSAVGVYGVMSYSVAQRTHEIGIRIALGAKQGDVLALIVGQGLKTALLGLAIGLPVAFALSRLMASALFGIVALEASVLVGVVLLLAALAIVSSYLPALRATKVDPMVALRCD
jgi:putative ABC transport system permease protein